ncbi:S8 family serine peptidase [Candidatus Woesearchaeota archaeon]|nr:S8 family serine peptidase [Candidatus Woesearchaeota archaeon]
MKKEIKIYLAIICTLIFLSSILIIGIANKISENHYSVNNNLKLNKLNLNGFKLKPPKEIKFESKYKPKKVNINKLKEEQELKNQQFEKQKEITKKRKSNRIIENNIIKLIQNKSSNYIDVLISVEKINDSIRKTITNNNGIIKKEFDFGNIISISINPQNINNLYKNKNIIHIGEEKKYKTFLTDSIPQIGSQFLVENGLTGKNIKVAIVDSGIDITDNSIFNNKIVEERSFVDDSPSTDEFGHGTHVAGIVANIATDTKLLNAKVTNNLGLSTTTNIVKGIAWSVQNNANIISLSLGTEEVDQFIHNAVDDAIEAGIIVVAASGNCGPCTSSSICGGFEGVMSPAVYEPVITVGAVDEFDDVACYSSRKDYTTYIKPDIMAPGSEIMSTQSGGGSEERTGTSMAAPHVSAVIAMLLELNSSNQVNMKNLLESTSIDKGNTGKDIDYGSGLLDTEKLFSTWTFLNEYHTPLLIHENINGFEYLNSNNDTVNYTKNDNTIRVDVLNFTNQNEMLNAFGIDLNYYILNDIEISYFVSENNTIWFTDNVIYNITHNGNEYQDILNSYLVKYDSTINDYIISQSNIKKATTDKLTLTKIQDYELIEYDLNNVKYSNGTHIVDVNIFDFANWNYDFTNNINNEILIDYVEDGQNVFYINNNIVYNITKNADNIIFNNYTQKYPSQLNSYLQEQINVKKATTDKLILNSIENFDLVEYDLNNVKYSNGTHIVDVNTFDFANWDYDFTPHINNERTFLYLHKNNKQFWLNNNTVYNVTDFNADIDNSIESAYEEKYPSELFVWLQEQINIKKATTNKLILNSIENFDLIEYNANYAKYSNGTEIVEISIVEYTDLDDLKNKFSQFEILVNTENENETYVDNNNNIIWIHNNTIYNISSSGIVFDNYIQNYNSNLKLVLKKEIDFNKRTQIVNSIDLTFIEQSSIEPTVINEDFNYTINDDEFSYINNNYDMTILEFNTNKIGNYTIFMNQLDFDIDLILFRENEKIISQYKFNEAENFNFEKNNNDGEKIYIVLIKYERYFSPPTMEELPQLPLATINIKRNGIGCFSQVSNVCHTDGNIWWKNSCNELEEIKNSCSYGCTIDNDQNICLQCTQDSQCSVGSVCQSNTCVQVEEVEQVSSCSEFKDAIENDININITNDIDCQDFEKNKWNIPSYSKTIEGNGFTISNLVHNYRSRNSKERSGIILNSDNAKMQNVNFKNYHVYCRSSNCGLISEGKINLENVNLTGSVSGGNNVGSVIGSGSLIANNVQFQGTVKGNDNVGGIVGRMNPYEENNIEKIKVDATINGNEYVGGLFGSSSAGGTNVANCVDTHINNSYINVNINSNAYSGGVFGKWACKNGIIENVYVDGSINARNFYTGGFSGEFGYFSAFLKGDFLFGKIKNSFTKASVGNKYIKKYKKSGVRWGSFGPVHHFISSWNHKWKTLNQDANDCYFIGNDISADGLCKGLNESELINVNSFQNWDFENTWNMTNEGPKLLAFN